MDSASIVLRRSTDVDWKQFINTPMNAPSALVALTPECVLEIRARVLGVAIRLLGAELVCDLQKPLSSHFNFFPLWEQLCAIYGVDADVDVPVWRRIVRSVRRKQTMLEAVTPLHVQLEDTGIALGGSRRLYALNVSGPGVSTDFQDQIRLLLKSDKPDVKFFTDNMMFLMVPTFMTWLRTVRSDPSMPPLLRVNEHAVTTVAKRHKKTGQWSRAEAVVLRATQIKTYKLQFEKRRHEMAIPPGYELGFTGADNQWVGCVVPVVYSPNAKLKLTSGQRKWLWSLAGRCNSRSNG
jgi:hypothetical protein